MYPTSNDYNDAILENARAHKLKGNVNGTPFTGKNVIRGSFVVKNQMCPATAIELGGVYVGECDLVFTTEFATSLGIRGSWKGVVLTPEIGVELADATFEYVPMGVFTVEEAQWTTGGLKIIAYDNMSKFDKTLNLTTTSGYLFSFLNYACLQCGVTLGMTEGQVRALPNGDEPLGLMPGSPMVTFRDMISELAEMTCSFATIDRQGCLILVPFPNTSNYDLTITDKQRYQTSFSDYSSFYSAIDVENIGDGTRSFYYNDNVGGLVLPIDGNPFIQYGTDAIIAQMRNAIVDALEDFNATPFSVSILPNPAIELGDIIRFTGGVGNNSVGMVMSTVHKVDSTKIEGYGENPTAAGVISELQKELNATANNVKKEEGITYYLAENVDQIVIGENVEPLFKITFASTEMTTVTMWHEIKMSNEFDDPSQLVELFYYFDDELVTYNPAYTYGEEGVHTWDTNYCQRLVEPGRAHTWEVKAKTDNGTATIEIGDLHARLEGQRLVASDEWPGVIEAEDEFTPIVLHRGVVALSEVVGVTVIDTSDPTQHIRISTSDTMSPFTLRHNVVTLNESCNVTTEAPKFYIITENGDNLATEDGDLFVTNH